MVSAVFLPLKKESINVILRELKRISSNDDVKEMISEYVVDETIIRTS
jgi:hypothetical protein